MILIVSCSFTISTAKTSQADLVSYTFQGNLTGITDNNNLLNGQFSAGNLFHGSFTYDTSAPENSSFLTDPTTGLYSAVRSFTVNINGYNITRVSSSLYGYLQVWDNANSIDAFTLNSGIVTPPIAIGSGTVISSVDFNLYDFTHTASKNGKLIPTTVNLSDYGYRSFDIFEGNMTTNQYFILDGTITDLQPTPTPIPAAAWLMGSGLIGLIGMRKRATV
ncbi:MAG: VPLPA-CTERM sorting domain-containing protein [Bacteroidota bacterium]